jgi:RNA polymerase sigma-70 factor (ECF subfamily)
MSKEKDLDDEFRSALSRGDESAWFAFHQRYTLRLIRYARAIVKDEQLAHDAVQAIMVGLVRNRTRLEQIQNLEAYLFSALRRDLWRMIKQVQKEAALLAPLESERNGSSISLQLADRKLVGTNAEDRDYLHVALSLLSDEQRAVIELRFFGELTFECIAGVLQLPMGTIVSRYRAGLQLLRHNLEDQA